MEDGVFTALSFFLNLSFQGGRYPNLHLMSI
jgi:hypothetical protein